MEAYQIKIKLKNSNPLVWRRVLIPRDVSFKYLHDVIQQSLDFRDKHLYVFKIPNEDIKITNDQEAFELYQEYLIDHKQIQATLLALGTDFAKTQLKALQTAVFKPEQVHIKSYFKVGMKVDYLYDFGDRWEISLEVEDSITNNIQSLPRVLAGACGAPVEDMGGLRDFEEFREAYTNLEHQNHAITFKWGQEQGFSDYDLQGIQERLEKIANGEGQ